MARQPASIPRALDHLDAATLRRRQATAGERAGLEPWWPLDGLSFVVLSSGSWRLASSEGDGPNEEPPPDDSDDEE